MELTDPGVVISFVLVGLSCIVSIISTIIYCINRNRRIVRYNTADNVVDRRQPAIPYTEELNYIPTEPIDKPGTPSDISDLDAILASTPGYYDSQYGSFTDT